MQNPMSVNTHKACDFLIERLPSGSLLTDALSRIARTRHRTKGEMKHWALSRERAVIALSSVAKLSSWEWLRIVQRCASGMAAARDGSLMIPSHRPDEAVIRYVRALAKRLAREDHEAEIAARQASQVTSDTT